VEAAKVQPGDLINGRRVRGVAKPKPARTRKLKGQKLAALSFTDGTVTILFKGQKLAALSFTDGTVTILFEDHSRPLTRWPKAMIEVQRP
jgi:hypothetical protein